MPFPACCVPLGISLAGKPDDDRVSDFTFSLPLAKGGICIVLTGDDLNRNAGNSYGLGLNIRHGHGATIVVRGR